MKKFKIKNLNKNKKLVLDSKQMKVVQINLQVNKMNQKMGKAKKIKI
jgi:hypothetical protein